MNVKINLTFTIIILFIFPCPSYDYVIGYANRLIVNAIFITLTIFGKNDVTTSIHSIYITIIYIFFQANKLKKKNF